MVIRTPRPWVSGGVEADSAGSSGAGGGSGAVGLGIGEGGPGCGAGEVVGSVAWRGTKPWNPWSSDGERNWGAGGGSVSSYAGKDCWPGGVPVE